MTLTEMRQAQLADRQRRFAAYVVRRAESALRRTLSDGERTDLLADNSTWTLDKIEAIVKEMRQ